MIADAISFCLNYYYDCVEYVSLFSDAELIESIFPKTNFICSSLVHASEIN